MPLSETPSTITPALLGEEFSEWPSVRRPEVLLRESSQYFVVGDVLVPVDAVVQAEGFALQADAGKEEHGVTGDCVSWPCALLHVLPVVNDPTLRDTGTGVASGDVPALYVLVVLVVAVGD